MNHLARAMMKIAWVVAAVGLAAQAGARAESSRATPPEQERPSRISVEQTCAGKPQEVACWKELSNQPGCYVWNPFRYGMDWTTTWTGECSDGLAQGTGTLTTDSRYKAVSTGLLRDGKKHGHWVTRWESGVFEGAVWEGPYVDGNRHGRWIASDRHGKVWKGSYVEDKKQGHWVLTGPNGERREGPYVDGKQHGHWVERLGGSSFMKGPYVEGKKHGQWVERYGNGTVGKGPYVNGRQTGRWVLRRANREVMEGFFVNGMMRGRWVSKNGVNGRITVYDFENGQPKRR